MRMVLPRSLRVIGIKSIKKWHGEKMAEFGKNTKGISLHFLSKIAICSTLSFSGLLLIYGP